LVSKIFDHLLDSIKLVVNGDTEFFLYFLEFVVEVFGLIE